MSANKSRKEGKPKVIEVYQNHETLTCNFSAQSRFVTCGGAGRHGDGGGGGGRGDGRRGDADCRGAAADVEP